MSGGQLRSQWEPVTKQFISIHGPLDQPAFYFDPRYDQGDFKNPVPSNVARGHNGVILPGPPREGPPDDGSKNCLLVPPTRKLK